MNWMHRLKHVFGWYRAQVVTVRLNGNETKHWIGFQCVECGDISALTRVYGPSWVREKHRELPMNIVLVSKWFAWPPHIIKHAVEGLETLGMWIALAIEWLTREFM